MLNELTPEPQAVATLAKRLRMTKGQLQQVIAANRDALVAHGVQLHVATASEVAKAMTLSSGMNAAEPTFYSKLSRQLTLVRQLV